MKSKLKNTLYQKGDNYRFYETEKKRNLSEEKYRTNTRRDYSRVLHSPSFRRLGGKTQLFPGNESDFFRNRLTHSLEVAQISKDIAIKINNKKAFKKRGWLINPDIPEIAGLMHDLGHAPFGHNGEKALDNCMKGYGGFEGNAQTLRIITRLEKKEFFSTPRKDMVLIENYIDKRRGLNLTARVIASAMKYDKCIPIVREKTDKLEKGYYHSEKDLISKIKEKVISTDTFGNLKFKTIECSIMDIADDIAYSTYDIEDALKAGFLSAFDIISIDNSILSEILKSLDEELRKDKTEVDIRNILVDLLGEYFEEMVVYQYDINSSKKDIDYFINSTLSNVASTYNRSKRLSENGYSRTSFASYLVSRFISGIKIVPNDEYPCLSKIKLKKKTELEVSILKNLARISLINSSKLKIIEYRGYDIIKSIFKALNSKEGFKLLPEDVQDLFNSFEGLGKKRVICDFIAGMTDRYALEFYCRLFSENPQTIFKPF